MAMNGQALGAAIANVIIAQDADAESKAAITKLWQNVASEIVSHIQANATVTVTVNTTGSATAQAGTGTGTVA